MYLTLSFNPLPRFHEMLMDRRGDDYAEKAVILVVMVLLGVAAFSGLGARIVEMIGQTTSGI